MQAAKLAPSRLHWKLAVASLSVNENDALVAVVGSGGLEVIVGAGGGGGWIVHVCDAAALVQPAFVACTWNLWDA